MASYNKDKNSSTPTLISSGRPVNPDKLTSVKVILERLRIAQCNYEIKKQFYKLRRVLAGDFTVIGSDGTPVTRSEYSKSRRENSQFPNFMKRVFEEGVSDHTAIWCKQLVLSTVATKIEVSSPELDPDILHVREDWLNDRLKKCDFFSIQQTFLIDYLTTGFSFLKVGMQNDYPAVFYADPINLYWDVHNDYPSYRFMAERLTIPEDLARQEFGDAEIDKIVGASKDGIYEDCVPIIEYWDGTTLAYVDTTFSRVLLRKKNPLGEIPYICMRGMTLPSNTIPTPHILAVIGMAAGHAELQRSMMEIYKRLKPAMILNPDSFTEESYRSFMNNPEDISVLVLKPATPDNVKAIEVINFPQLGAEAIRMKQELENEIVQSLGVNPFRSGIAPHADFAAQVAAIDTRSGLIEGHIINDLSLVFSELAEMMFRIGAKYDDNPYKVRLNEHVIEFDTKYSIQRLLRDDVPIEAFGKSFESPGTKIQKAVGIGQGILQLAQLRKIEPKLADFALTQILAAYGVRNIHDLLTPTEADQDLLNMLHSLGITDPKQLMGIIQAITQQNTQQQQLSTQPQLQGNTNNEQIQ